MTDAAANLGDPQGSMLFYSVYLFQQGFQDFRMGYASAMAWVLFVITMVCTRDDHQGLAALGALPGRRVPMSGTTSGITDAARARDGRPPTISEIDQRPVPPDVRRHRFLMTRRRSTPA